MGLFARFLNSLAEPVQILMRAELADRRDLLRREVLIAFRQPAGTDAAGRVHRRAAEATAALAAAGVTLAVLDGPAAAGCVARALDPPGPPRPEGSAGTSEPVTTANTGQPKKGSSR